MSNRLLLSLIHSFFFRKASLYAALTSSLVLFVVSIIFLMIIRKRTTSMQVIHDAQRRNLRPAELTARFFLSAVPQTFLKKRPTFTGIARNACIYWVSDAVDDV